METKTVFALWDDKPDCFGIRYSKTNPYDVVKNKEVEDVSADSS